ncbi:Protein CBG22095 [Caenorhabditis briggsae]|uniref:Protein CBG22095 n=1 Tax=Caenorhabditis briggsae TaxID=6238 RepID=A8Y1I5_CAEBR|nr:Protein CBG22095 [Caenorhabditis briggsae]CAP38754.1 Protein CBG22095 [Caenorhabditis briggsae]
MKPEDLKKSRVIPSGPSTSATSGGIKAKLDFRTPTGIPPKPALNSTANHPSVQSSQLVRPHLDDKWKEFGDSIVLNLETFEKSVDDAILAGNFNKVARMFVAALKSFLEGDKLKIELRLMGTIGLTVKTHGDKLNVS